MLIKANSDQLETDPDKTKQFINRFKRKIKDRLKKARNIEDKRTTLLSHLDSLEAMLESKLSSMMLKLQSSNFIIAFQGILRSKQQKLS
mmetsp:Transcript_22085/g.40233  ORF Transcript_22085/g.40233 Transcript_22085/m.40233 type:complete len:89 (-) Transcript_22085:391-657(-)